MLLTEQDKQKALISQLAETHSRKRSALIPILQTVQRDYGEVSQFALQHIADVLGLHAADVYSVATFYQFINTKPKGKFIIRLSRDMSSIMKGAKIVARQLENDLGIKFGETTPDGMFTLEWTSCIGMNYQAPAMMINNEVFSNLTPQRAHLHHRGLPAGLPLPPPDRRQDRRDLFERPDLCQPRGRCRPAQRRWR